MSTLVLPMASPKSFKRTYEEAGLESEASGEQHSQEESRHKSPKEVFPRPVDVHSHAGNYAHPNTPISDIDSGIPSTIMTTGILPMPSAMTAEGTKKHRLTFPEREAKRVEKEVKDLQRAEERAKKEDERLRREKEKAEREIERLKRAEEKRQKDEEKRRAKEERERAREEEKAKRDEERQKKEEEKSKKARSQLSLNAFFGQQSMPTRSSTASPALDDITPISSRRSSIAEMDVALSRQRSRSISETPKKPQLSDFERMFPPFFVKTHMSLAPINRFTRDEACMSYVKSKVDGELLQGIIDSEQNTKLDLERLLHLAPHKRTRCSRQFFTVKDIVSRIDGAAQNPIDLTRSSDSRRNPSDLLISVPVKYLKFAEDVRPPYIGTYTRITSPSARKRISRNPFSRSLPQADYDYDSEAEWEEPGEGEDLDSEGEEELDEEDEGEMEGFLDDEQAIDAQLKRRPLLGDLEPTCTGICWAEQHTGPDLTSYSIDMLTESPSFPIDPYSTSYWHHITPSKPSTSTSINQSTLMEPPRIPLHPIDGSNSILTPSQIPGHKHGLQSSASYANAPNSLKPPKRLVPDNLVNDFKAAVEGSDLTKVGLVEQLKKKFPKQSKDVIKDSLDVFAERVGEKLADKRWVLKSRTEGRATHMHFKE